MSKLSKRLMAITKYVDINDSLVDIGCDHGLLSIYLIENNICQKVIASDINPNALKNAKNNISSKKLEIPTILSDGLSNIDVNGINTLIISGMGTKTIIHILTPNKLNNINKIILQSNNDYYLLRKELNRLGYYLEKEEETFDKDKWYITMLFKKSEKKNSPSIIKYGYLNNKSYIDFLIKKDIEILKKVPLNKEQKRKTIQKEIDYLNNKLK